MPIPVEDASGFQGSAERWLAPSSVEELAAALAEAHRLGIPVTPSGAGTGITGGRCPDGGWVLSLERFTRLEAHAGYAVSGAGTLLKDVQAAAAKSGQFYAPDPTEWTASIGGNIATNASGSRSFRYGSTRRHIRALTAVFMDGSIRTFRRGEPLDFSFEPVPAPATTKNTAGYALQEGATWIDLLAGSEGTLAIVAEAELDLLPQPRQLLSGVVFFPDDESALAAVDLWRPIPQLNMLEYMDAPSLDFLRGPYSNEIPRKARACLMIEQELDGLSGDAVDEWVDRLETAGALEDSWFGETARDRERFRAYRHTLPELVNAKVRANGFQKLSSDFAVPLSANSRMLAFYRESLAETCPGRFTIYGHIGDAHVHVNILSASSGHFEAGKQWMTLAAQTAVALGGTVSAEHGLGKRKRQFLPLMYSERQILNMYKVKRRLDPNALLSRGTLFPDLLVVD
ncbi:MAG: FAD-binding oxidoreductase [Acidobacteria bacterium]|nr:FAD-binding oxidoreductase [Acidobacteriota bacterium]